MYIRYNSEVVVPEGVPSSQFFEIPRTWNRVKLSLDKYEPKVAPKWLEDLENVVEGQKWNPYAFVVEPVLFCAGLSRTNPARHGVDDLGIYFSFDQ